MVFVYSVPMTQYKTNVLTVLIHILLLLALIDCAQEENGRGPASLCAVNLFIGLGLAGMSFSNYTQRTFKNDKVVASKLLF